MYILTFSIWNNDDEEKVLKKKKTRKRAFYAKTEFRNFAHKSIRKDNMFEIYCDTFKQFDQQK